MYNKLMIDSISHIAKQAIENKVFPGCVVGVVRTDGTRLVLPFGKFTYEANSPLVQSDTIYDVASLTKSIPTSSLALQLIDEGKLSLEKKLIDYLPEFNNDDRSHIYIKHLLTYTLAGYGFTTAAATLSQKDISNLTAADLTHTLLTNNFTQAPGTNFSYTNIPAMLLGLVIEKISNRTLDELAAERFFTPLEMNRTTFHPEQFPSSDIPPTEHDQWRGLVQGVVHDESAYIYKQENKIVGHAGLFSTAPDILNFLEMLLNDGVYKNKQFISKNLCTIMNTNQIPHLNDQTGLGFELSQPRFMGPYCNQHTFGKTGFTGTVFVVDKKKEIAYVLLSNRTYPKRPMDSSAINQVRAAIGTVLLGT